MSTNVVILDWRPPFLGTDSARSLLLAPVDDGDLLSVLREQVARVGVDGITIWPAFPVDDEYRAAVQRAHADVRVVAPEARVAQMAEFEPADRLLFLDARYIAPHRLDVRELERHGGGKQFALHVMHLQRNAGGLRERVSHDETLRVSAVQRLYDGVTHLQAAAVGATLIPVAVFLAGGSTDLTCLAQLRSQLATYGVPSRDVVVRDTLIDVSRAAGLLSLSRLRLAAFSGRPARAGLAQHAAGVWQAPGVRIHRESRIVGPVVLHEDVSVARGAVLVGPLVVGAGARIGRDAVLAEGLVAPGVRVPARVCASGRFVAHRGAFREPHTPREAASTHAAGGYQSADMLPARGFDAAAKRVFDATASAAGLLVIAPILLATALLIKLTSRGPVLFGHEREGRGGRGFRCWKFRTMVHNAHAMQRALYAQNKVDGPQFKMDRDPRITRLGAFLRASNIDELPQLFNVLRGDMSLIGPRPSPFRENQICVPWREARLSVRPGITGLWQVCRHDRDMGDFHQWIHFDMLYVRHRSFWLDMRILLATFLTAGGRWGVPAPWLIPALRRRRSVVPAQRPTADAPTRISASLHSTTS